MSSPTPTSWAARGLFQVQRSAGAALLPARVIGVSMANDLAWSGSTRARERWTLPGSPTRGRADRRVRARHGDPLGLTDSVTQGIVSSTSRWIKERGSGFIVNAIQTSAGINPGNSGGGLVDLNGEVIGIPTLEGYDPRQRSAAPGIGFAIPSNTVTRVASKLIGAYGHSVKIGRAHV